MNPKYKKLIIPAAIIAVLVIIGLAVFNYFHSAKLIVQVAPINATITINGKKISGGENTFFPAENQTISVSAEGFGSKNVTVNLERAKVTKLAIYLVPENGDYGFYEKQENEASLALLLNISGYNNGTLNPDNNITIDQDHTADAFIDKISIKDHVPIKTWQCGKPATRSNCNAISVEYGYYANCSNALCVNIVGRTEKMSDEVLEEVKEKVSAAGYNLDDYNYIYTQENR